MREPVGHVALREILRLPVPAPAVESYIVAGARRTEVQRGRVIEHFPRQYRPDGSVVSHLRFALRHEPTDLGVIVAALKAIDPSELAAWVRREPTGAYSRRAWFLYETFTGRTLDVESVTAGNYVEALDSGRHIVAERRNSPRHRVIDNLLGGPRLCPTVRRTPRLEAQIAARIDEEARALAESYDPLVLARAVGYLYTKETRSSFALEGETPTSARAERFVAALRAAPSLDPSDKAALIRLQGEIVEPRYAATGWRDLQNFVGETLGSYREKVHFVSPRPRDVADLMEGWMAPTRRVSGGVVDPVVAAALSSFAFVFVHLFEDGNGRIHRFLIHHILARREFGPPGIIFPISASMLRDRRSYDEALEMFSSLLLTLVDWYFTADQQLVVANDTSDLYRYFDATLLAEYLYDRVVDTVRRDLKGELGFLAVYDRALTAVRDIIDMPDRRASRLVRLCMQNGGLLSRARRDMFSELSDDEVATLEAAVQSAMRDQAQRHPTSGWSYAATLNTIAHSPSL